METNMNLQNDEVEIDLREILFLLLDKMLLILLVSVIMAGVAFLGTKFFITPKYQSETRIYVRNQNEEATANANDYVTSNYITKDYEQLILSQPVLDKVIADLSLQMTSAQLKNLVTIENISDTRIIKIIVTDTDSYRARKIANALREASTVKIKEIMGIEEVKVVQEANLNDSPISPNVLKNMIIGFVIGMIVTIAIIVIRHLTDDTIKSQDDIEKYLGISTLATIPVMSEAEWDGEKSPKNTKNTKNNKKTAKPTAARSNTSNKSQHTGSQSSKKR